MQNNKIPLLILFTIILAGCNIPNSVSEQNPAQSSQIWDLSNLSGGIYADTQKDRSENSPSGTATPQLYMAVDFDSEFGMAVPVNLSGLSVSVNSGSDSAKWLYFDPAEYSSNPSDTLYAVFQNDGSEIWTENYHLEFFAGENPSSENIIYLDHNTASGEQAVFKIPVESEASTWKSCWRLKNSKEEAFFEFCYNHGKATGSQEEQKVQNSTEGTVSEGISHPFAKTNGTAPERFSSDAYSAEFISTSPSDGHTFTAYDHSETLTVSFKNNGSNPWDSSYSLVFYSGYNWMHANSFSLQNDTASGETAVFSLPIEIYEDNDKWVTCWYLSTPDGKNLSDFCFNYYTRS